MPEDKEKGMTINPALLMYQLRMAMHQLPCTNCERTNTAEIKLTAMKASAVCLNCGEEFLDDDDVPVITEVIFPKDK